MGSSKLQAPVFIDGFFKMQAPVLSTNLPKPASEASLLKRPGAEISNELAELLLKHPKNGAIWLVPFHFSYKGQ